jgi:hypothetical protein
MMFAAQDQRVVDLHFWMLNPLSAPLDDMLCIITKEFVNVIQPSARLRSITRLHIRSYVKIEAGNIVSGDPTSLRYQPVVDEDFLARDPCHLLDGPVLI